jgi:cytochrome d ubiquinol oxidase subunit II
VFLDTLPLVFVLAGLVLYVALGGADFGAGIWQLLAGGGERGDAIREHAHHSMGPVWEANHVWLIFILTVTWTAYPTFLGSLASTLGAAFFIAGLGIILRGASYALRSAAETEREMRVVDGAFAVASLVAPFALGAAAGAVASERVPVGNASGALFASWLNPTSILIGLLAVAFCAYLAAVYLAADAARLGQSDMTEAFRRRALGAGVVAGALAVVGLIVVHADARSLFTGLVHGAALAAMVVSALAGATTMGLVARGSYEWARGTAVAAVGAVIAGWAFARYPVLLPGLTVRGAAAGHDALVCLVVAVLAGAAILFPSLALLFALVLRGRLGEDSAAGEPSTASEGQHPPRGLPARPALGARVAVALLIVGVGTLNAADAAWAHLIGVVSLAGFILVGLATILPRMLAEEEQVL